MGPECCAAALVSCCLPQGPGGPRGRGRRGGRMRVTDAYPARALNAPGREAVIVVEIETEGADSGSGSSGEEGKAAELLIELLDRAQVVSRSVVSVASTGGPSRREVPIAVPPARAGASDRQDGAGGARGYEVKVTLQASSGSTE